MFGSKKKSKSKEESTHYSLRMERKKKQSGANNHSAEYLCRNTSSSESLENKIKGSQQGLSLDRSYENDAKPQMKPKRSSWFLRDKNRDKQSSKNEKFFKRASLDFSLTFDTKQGVDSSKPRSRVKTIYRQNAADYTGDSSTTPQEEVPDPIKKLSKFQIGKRFLKGEIGIRSFNYYLLKEGLKKNSSIKSKPEKAPFMSKSEENIYEEIFFHHDKVQKPQTPQLPPNLPPPNKLQVSKQPENGNCLKCEICLQEAAQEKHKLQNCDNCVNGNHQQHQQVSALLAEGYATVRKLDNATIYDFFQQQQQAGNSSGILQFQSYNPNNPNVYKIETTPVAFSEYNLTIEDQLYQQHYAALMALQQQQQQQYSGDGKIMTKSSSSSDSIRQRQQDNMANEFYTRPNYFYPSNNNTEQNQSSMRKDNNNSIYKTDSSNSLRSENSLNKNNSQKSNQNEVQTRQEMSDSSLGDSLFSSDANKRYFGSSESCRFNYECDGRARRCSYEENEKCSFSDTCRNYETECNLRNCDCSSSYFSSDFDDTNNIYSTANNGRVIKTYHNESIHDTSKSHYADDFIKHVNNVKRRAQNTPYDGGNNVLITTSIYDMPKANPKRLERNENDENKLKTTGTVPKSSISSNESRKSNSQRQKHPLKDTSGCQVANAENKEVAIGNLDIKLPLSEASSMPNLEKKTTVVENIKKQLPLGNKVPTSTENDTVQQKAQKATEQPKIVVAVDDNDDEDDEVFINHATIVMTVNEDKKASENPQVHKLENSVSLILNFVVDTSV